jgi:prolyl 4-hydroxylase
MLDEAQRLTRAGRRDEAVALVRRSAAEGDSEAAFALANWHLYGLYVPRDRGSALALLRAAAAAGHGDSARLLAGLAEPAEARSVLAASGDPESARQLALIEAMDEAERPSEILCEDPPVRLVRGLLSAEECAWLGGRAAPLLRPSTIVDAATGRPRPDPVRTSDGMNFGPAQMDAVVAALIRRLHAAVGIAPQCGEPLHVLRYMPGQEFRPHLDALSGVANQRAWTALVYLNDGYEGGETILPELGLSVRARAGDGLIFRNVDSEGRADPRTRHAGAPVRRGAKWLASRWIRERPFDPFMPR